MIAGTGYTIVEDLGEVWPAIVDRARRSRTPILRLLHIIEDCKTGRALCLSCEDGLVIVALHALEGGGFKAVVQLAVSTSCPGAFKRQEGDMLKLARAVGASVLAFETDRRGWGRLLGPEWALNGEVYSRSV